tara:strand:- start:381 stop:503 length:123 start_codon:yes stop_codon:yes gene_type:complete
LIVELSPEVEFFLVSAVFGLLRGELVEALKDIMEPDFLDI